MCNINLYCSKFNLRILKSICAVPDYTIFNLDLMTTLVNIYISSNLYLFLRGVVIYIYIETV
jgi:hypothetical protein